MRLFLASEAKHPDTIEKLRKHIGGFEGRTIAYIPTAQNGESNFGDWKENSTTWKLVNTLGAKVTSVQLEDYKSPNVIEQLRGKDIIWIAGGACGYLMYWMFRTQLDRNMKEILENGSLYVGSSAGI